MKEYIPLDCQKYWNASVDVELKQVRRRQRREATGLIFNAVIAIAFFAGIGFAWSGGMFEDVNLAKSINGFSDAGSMMYNNVKEAFWKL